MPESENILLAGFEREFQRSVGLEDESPELTRRLEESMRLAILFSAESALVPAPGYFETSSGHRVVRHFKPSQERGQLMLTGTGAGPYDFICSKLDHWRRSERETALYEEAGPSRASELDRRAWQTKQRPTDGLLIANWQRAIEAGTHPLLSPLRRAGISTGRASRIARAVPEQLEGTVILADNVATHLPRGVALRGSEHHMLRLHLGNGFFDSYLREARAAALVDSTVHMSPALFPEGARTVRDARLRRLLQALGMEQMLVNEASPDLLADVADGETWRCLRTELAARAGEGDGMLRRHEVKAITKAREKGRLGLRAELSTIEDSLDRQHEALEKAAQKGPTRWDLSVLASLGEGATIAMGAQRSLGEAQWGGGRFDTGRALSGPRLERELLLVLDSRDAGELERRVIALDAVLTQQEHAASPQEIVALVRGRDTLVARLGATSPALRRTIFSIATGAGGSLVAEGLLLAIKALGG